MARDLERYNSAYNELPFEDVVEGVRRKVLVDFILELRKADPQNLLEIGVGRRSIFADLPDQYGGLAVEPDPLFLGAVKAELDVRGVEYHNCFFEELITGTSFNLVVASSVLHEVVDDHHFLSRARSFLRDDGMLIVIVPNAASIHRLIGVHLGIISSVSGLSDTNIRMQQARVYSFALLKERLLKAGLKPVRMFSFLPKLLDHQSLSNAMNDGEIDGQFLNQMNNLSHRLPEVGSEIFAVAVRD